MFWSKKYNKIQILLEKNKIILLGVECGIYYL
jgi:hypothetical protein